MGKAKAENVYAFWRSLLSKECFSSGKMGRDRVCGGLGGGGLGWRGGRVVGEGVNVPSTAYDHLSSITSGRVTHSALFYTSFKPKIYQSQVCPILCYVVK